MKIMAMKKAKNIVKTVRRTSGTVLGMMSIGMKPMAGKYATQARRSYVCGEGAAFGMIANGGWIK